MRSDMNQAYEKSLNTDNNISLTGYRSLFLLLELLKSAKTREELLYCFSKDPIIKSNLSKDTVTNTINALKAAGCVISRPTQKTENKYVLKSHPFILRLSKENVQLLLAIRESIVTLGDWQLLINLNNLYAKIALLAPDWDSQRMLLYEHPFKYINSQIFSAVLLNSKLKKHLMICYNSPENGEENLIFTPEYITLENKKLYVWGFNKKYETFSYLRIDRIRKINYLNFLGSSPEYEDFDKQVIVAKYKLKGLSALMYVGETNEIILESNTNSEYPLTIEAHIDDKFNFIQRVLSYGSDCLIISPDEIKSDLLKYLEQMKSEYSK